MKKNLKLYVLIFISVVLVLILTKDVKMALLVFVLSLFLVYLNKNSQKAKNKKILKDKEYEFANLIAYLIVFLDNGFNVYQALRMSIPYCSKFLADDLNVLVDEIDKDKSIVPYQNFSQKFESNIIVQVLTMLYQLDTNGYDVKYLNKFPSLINKMRQAKIENSLRIQKSNMSFLTYAPIVGLLIVVFSFSIFILEFAGGVIGG